MDVWQSRSWIGVVTDLHPAILLRVVMPTGLGVRITTWGITRRPAFWPVGCMPFVSRLTLCTTSMSIDLPSADSCSSRGPCSRSSRTWMRRPHAGNRSLRAPYKAPVEIDRLIEDVLRAKAARRPRPFTAAPERGGCETPRACRGRAGRCGRWCAPAPGAASIPRGPSRRPGWRPR